MSKDIIMAVLAFVGIAGGFGLVFYVGFYYGGVNAQEFNDASQSIITRYISENNRLHSENNLLREWIYCPKTGWHHVWKYPDNDNTYYIDGMQYEPWGADFIQVPCEGIKIDDSNKYSAKPTAHTKINEEDK